MSSKLQISIPQAASWLLRLAAHPQLSDNVCCDAVAFSAWYAAANSLVDWPDEVETIQRTERAKKLSLDRVMKLLAQMNHTFSGRASAEQAKLSSKAMRATIGSPTIPLYFVPSHRISRRPSERWMTFPTTPAKPSPRLPRGCISSGRYSASQLSSRTSSRSPS